MEYAGKLLKSLSSDGIWRKPEPNRGFILMHSTGSLPNGSEIDTPLNYADYYYLEALLRYMQVKEIDYKHNLIHYYHIMKTIRYIFSIFLLMLAVVADAQQLRQEAFELINLDYPGLEKVKAACSRQKWEAAAQELLNYYRSRTGITHPDIDLKNLTISRKNRNGRMMLWSILSLYIKAISFLQLRQRYQLGVLAG